MEFSFTDNLVLELWQCCFGLLHSFCTLRLLINPAAVIYVNRKHLFGVAGLLEWGEGGQNLLGMSLPIPLGEKQVDAGLWDNAPARRSICLLVT